MRIKKGVAPMTVPRRELADKPLALADAPASRAQKLLAAGGVLGALAASSCCVLPLALFSLGVSGAWIGNLTRLAPYQSWFLAFTAACLGYGYWLTYRARQATCGGGAACARPPANRVVMAGLVLATILVAGALAVNFLAPLFLT
jgi:mercuric ion transport protein